MLVSVIDTYSVYEVAAVMTCAWRIQEGSMISTLYFRCIPTLSRYALYNRFWRYCLIEGSNLSAQ